MAYNDKHRAFLQFLMNGVIVHDERAKAVSEKIFDDDANMSSIISKINDKLSPIAMSLKSGVCEVTGQKYWSVVGTAHEDSVTFPSEFSVQQRAFLRAVYSEIVSSENGCISSMDCVNLATSLDSKFKVSDAEDFMKNMTRKRFFHFQNGVYFMGVRSIMEMMPYFRSTYQENFHNCFLCKEVMFHGHKCEHCDKVYHFYCISRKLADLEQDKCPNCSRSMDCSEIIEFSNTQNQNETQAQQDAENINEPMAISDDELFSQPISAPRKSRRTKANK